MTPKLFVIADREKDVDEVRREIYNRTGMTLNCRMTIVPSSIEFWRRFIQASNDCQALSDSVPRKFVYALMRDTTEDWLELLAASSAGDSGVVPMVGLFSLVSNSSRLRSSDMERLVNDSALAFIMETAERQQLSRPISGPDRHQTSGDPRKIEGVDGMKTDNPGSVPIHS